MKNVITYLIRGDAKSLLAFSRSIKLLQQNFLPWNQADVIVFHEDNVTPETIIPYCHGQNVKFALVDFSWRPDGLISEPKAMNLGGMGYRHMCHFFANAIFLRPELDGYDYQMRLDDDSFILSPIGFDVFGRIANGGFKYCYRAIEWDVCETCEGLWPFARDYFKNINGRKLRMPPPYRVYYTNFEINDIAWFRSQPWQDFAKAVDKTKGIWNYRWGDAPIRYLGVNGLLDSKERMCLKELHYFHQGEWKSGNMRRERWLWHLLGFCKFAASVKIRSWLRHENR